MATATISQTTLSRGTGLLARAYEYIGAHNNSLRYEYERDRAWQRTAMPLGSIVWIFVYHRWIVGTPVTPSEIAWACGALVYAIAGISFWAYLERRPTGGVHVQYAFLALDPL